MATFPIKSDLTIKEQEKMDALLAIDAAQRTTTQVDWLAARLPYQTNVIIKVGVDGNILAASGLTVPTGYSGFAKGATFTKTDASGNGLYMNIGDSTTASWDLIDEASTANISDGSVTMAKLADVATETFVGRIAAGTGVPKALTLSEAKTVLGLDETILFAGTPVNAVASAMTLVFTGVPANNDTVSIGGQVYDFADAISATGAYASGTLTVSGALTEGDQIQIGGVTYKMRANIGAGAAATLDLTFSDVAVATKVVAIEGTTYTSVAALTEAKASSTLTLTANMTDGNSVTIGSTTYTFKETLASANDVLIGASASDTIDNLIAAITAGAGEGTTYGTGTVAHTGVTAAAGAGDTMDVTALAIGTAGNLTTTELSGVGSWTGATMTGGVDAIANEVVVGATAELSIDNFISAMMATAGEGTTYSTGTVRLSTVGVAKVGTDVLRATALSVGFAGNLIAVSEDQTNAAWAGGATALAGGEDAEAANDVLIGASAEASIDNLVLAITFDAGVGTNEGVNYGTGTVAHTLVTAVKASAATMTVTALLAGDAGNAISTTDPTDDGSVLSFAAITLLGGEEAESANGILIEATAELTLDNLVSAINGTAGEGTKYGTGTVANASVTAAKTAADTMTVTAIVKGVSGDLVALAESGSGQAWTGGATFLAGGVDGTVGSAREVLMDATNLYIATAANTVADANWKKLVLQSL